MESIVIGNLTFPRLRITLAPEQIEVLSTYALGMALKAYSVHANRNPMDRMVWAPNVQELADLAMKEVIKLLNDDFDQVTPNYASHVVNIITKTYQLGLQLAKLK